MDRIADLDRQYQLLWDQFEKSEGTSAANLSRELRQVRDELGRLGVGEEVSRVDELAAKRARAGAGRPSSRRKSG